MLINLIEMILNWQSFVWNRLEIRLDDFMGEEHKMLAISDNLKLLKKEGYDIVSSIEEGMEQLQGESYNGSRY